MHCPEAPTHQPGDPRFGLYTSPTEATSAAPRLLEHAPPPPPLLFLRRARRPGPAVDEAKRLQLQARSRTEHAAISGQAIGEVPVSISDPYPARPPDLPPFPLASRGDPPRRRSRPRCVLQPVRAADTRKVRLGAMLLPRRRLGSPCVWWFDRRLESGFGLPP